MKDISLHLLDILENSTKAGAGLVEVGFEWEKHWLTVRIADNGPGFPDSVRDDPTDPFKTTRKERPVGLGLALLKEAAEQTGGSLAVEGPHGKGVRIEARFDIAHLDAKPLGDLAGVLAASLAAWPGMDLVVKVGTERDMVLDTRLVRKELDGVPFGNTKVQAWLSEEIRHGLNGLTHWADGVMNDALPGRR